jgi:hypothetical protein
MNKELFRTLLWRASEGYNDIWSQVDPEVLENFAELIVRECAKIVNDNNFAGSTMGNRLLFEHFGIET